MNYTIADFLIRLKNASMAKRKKLRLPHSKMNSAIAKILVKEGFLRQATDETKDNRKEIVCELAYEKRMPVLTDVTLFSKPSLRIYNSVRQLDLVGRRGVGIALVSTSSGVMTIRDAKKKGIGGELICKVS